MVGMFGDDHTACTRFGAGESQCQFVGFGTAAGKHRDIEVIGKLVRKFLGVIEHQFVQVAGVRVEYLRLFADGLDHAWMTVTDVRHIVVHVQVLSAVRVVQPYTLTGHNMHWLFIK